MHSIAIASILATAATLTAAAPSVVDRRGGYYVCYNNGFRGDCSVDPCAISWCPDYKPYTYERVSAPAPVDNTPTPPVINTPTAPKAYYVCANNGFRGDCTVDPCALAWCPDYIPYSYTPVNTVKRSDPTVCAPGTGYFQSCSNGFRGCCKSDACSTVAPGYCPIPVTKRAPASDPTVCAPGTGYFQSCSNGFRGCCKSDACSTVAPGYCPAPAVAKRAPEPAPASDPTVCAPGTGFYQVCGNGFKGCCKSDACSTVAPGYCPGSAPAPAPVPAPAPAPAPAANGGSDPTVCAPNTGFYQVCSNGFKGCCKKDACTLGYCPQ